MKWGWPIHFQEENLWMSTGSTNNIICLFKLSNKIICWLQKSNWNISDGCLSSPPLLTASLACKPFCQLVANSPHSLQCFLCEHSTGRCRACESCMDAKKSKTKKKKEEMKEHQVEETSCLSCSSTSCHLPCVLALLNSHETPLYNTGRYSLIISRLVFVFYCLVLSSCLCLTLMKFDFVRQVMITIKMAVMTRPVSVLLCLRNLTAKQARLVMTATLDGSLKYQQLQSNPT